jgi:hypothetical protein
MKKLILLAFILSPMVSLAGDNPQVGNAEAIYKSISAEAYIAHQEDGTTLFLKSGKTELDADTTNTYSCIRKVSLDLPQVEEYSCYLYTAADLAR